MFRIVKVEDRKDLVHFWAKARLCSSKKTITTWSYFPPSHPQGPAGNDGTPGRDGAVGERVRICYLLSHCCKSPLFSEPLADSFSPLLQNFPIQRSNCKIAFQFQTRALMVCEVRQISRLGNSSSGKLRLEDQEQEYPNQS